MNVEIDLSAVLAQAESDAVELIRVLDAETEALKRSDLQSIAHFAEDKRAYGQRIERNCSALRGEGRDWTNVPDERRADLASALQELAAAARRNMEALTVWRDAGQRVLRMVAEVAVDNAEAASGYGPGGRMHGGQVRPMNLNGVY